MITEIVLFLVLVLFGYTVYKYNSIVTQKKEAYNDLYEDYLDLCLGKLEEAREEKPICCKSTEVIKELQSKLEKSKLAYDVVFDNYTYYSGLYFGLMSELLKLQSKLKEQEPSEQKQNEQKQTERSFYVKVSGKILGNCAIREMEYNALKQYLPENHTIELVQN